MIHLGAFTEGIPHMAWQQDTTVLDSAVQVADSALQEAIVDTIFVAVGGGWATAAPIIASIVGAAAAVAITWFAWVTHHRDTEDRKERTRATDTRVSVRAHSLFGNLNAQIAKYASDDKTSFGWTMEFQESAQVYHKRIRRLVEESAGASAPVSEAIRLAYVNFVAARSEILSASRESDLGITANHCRKVHIHLKKCVGHLSQAVDDAFKSAAAGILVAPPALQEELGISDVLTVRLTDVADEESANEDDSVT